MADQLKLLTEALQGPDPDMIPSIQPLGWLYTAIQELKEPKKILESYETDPDAWWMMIRELEWIYEKGRAALPTGFEDDADDSFPAEDYAQRFDTKCRL